MGDNDLRGPYPPLSTGEQAAEWVRNVRLARAHFDAFQELEECRALIATLAADGNALADYLRLAYQGHRNAVIIHAAAAVDRSGGAISPQTLMAGRPIPSALRDLVTGAEGLGARIKFVRNKTVGHRSSTHTNKSAWARARLSTKELETAVEILEGAAGVVAELHSLRPYMISVLAPQGLHGLVRILKDQAESGAPAPTA